MEYMGKYLERKKKNLCNNTATSFNKKQNRKIKTV